MSYNGKWIINESVDSEVWDSEYIFDSKIEAIKFGIERFSEFKVGRIQEYVPGVVVEHILEHIVDEAVSEVGYVAEFYLCDVSREAMKVLEERFNAVLHQWLEETDNLPNFWKVVDVEMVKLNAHKDMEEGS